MSGKCLFLSYILIFCWLHYLSFQLAVIIAEQGWGINESGRGVKGIKEASLWVGRNRLVENTSLETFCQPDVLTCSAFFPPTLQIEAWDLWIQSCYFLFCSSGFSRRGGEPAVRNSISRDPQRTTWKRRRTSPGCRKTLSLEPRGPNVGLVMLLFLVLQAWVEQGKSTHGCQLNVAFFFGFFPLLVGMSSV